MGTTRAVLDTDVLISALLRRGRAHACLLAAEAGLKESVLRNDLMAAATRGQ